MLSSLVLALKDIEFTENGMPTNVTSGKANVDFFYKVGGMRTYDPQKIIAVFRRAWEEDPLTAMKNLFHTRDIRGGKGERRIFRILLYTLSVTHPEWVSANMHLIPLWGRWDDINVIMQAAADTFNHSLLDAATGFYVEAVKSGDGLACKWAGRHGNSRWPYAQMCIKHLFQEYDPKGDKITKNRPEAEWRRLVREHTKVVEQQMSAKQWDKIEYEHVPSQASLKYRKAFRKHDLERYQAYLEAVKQGKKTIHAGTLQPHQIINAVAHSNEDSPELEALWAARPKYIAPGTNPIAMCDISGSMMDAVDSIWKALSITMDIADQMTGFKNAFMTFTDVPALVQFDEGSSLRERVQQVLGLNAGYNTNIGLAMDTLLHAAIKNNIPVEEFPTHIVVVSDMQFDIITTIGGITDHVRDLYSKSPYPMPVVILWNVRTSKGVPAQADERGFVMVSGYSPAVIKHVLGKEALDVLKEPTSGEVFELAMHDYDQVVVPQEYQIEASSAAA